MPRLSNCKQCLVLYFRYGGNTMGHLARLQLVGRITYYLGWISLVCGALVHLNVGRAAFAAIDLTQRNLFEGSVVCFVICIASELRAAAPAASEAKDIVKKPLAA
jgi:hypothetical protein